MEEKQNVANHILSLPATRTQICFVGPMLGSNPGQQPSQGEALSKLLRSAGYDTLTTSSAINRYFRLFDILSTLVQKHNNIRIIVINVFSGKSFVVEDLASGLGRLLSLPCIFHIHGGAMPTFLERFPGWTDRVFKRADRIVVPSNYLARAMARSGFETQVIPNVINLDEYPFRLRSSIEPRLLWMRAFHPVYNPEMAVRVFAQVSREVPSATLTMAGMDLGWLQATIELARKLGVRERISFPGFLATQQKMQAGDMSDIFINTPRIDNQPVSVIEACAMGLPVVSTGVGGIPDLLDHNTTGLLVPDGDVEAMASAVIRLLREPKTVEHLSTEGRDLVKMSAPDVVLTQWKQLLSNMGIQPISKRSD